MDRIVLTIDREQWLALAASFRSNEFTCGDQALFIGKADCLAGLHRFVSGFESRHTNNRADDEVGLEMGCHTNCSRSAVSDLDIRGAGLVEANAQVVGVGFGCDGDHTRPPAFGLFERKIEVAASGEGDDLKSVRKRFNHAEGAPADRAGRSQDRDALHG